MRSYELMVIVSGSLEESAAHNWINTLTKQILRSAGRFTAHLTGGKAPSGLSIKKQSEGFYAIFNVVAPGGALDEVERTLRIADDVLRHKLLRLPTTRQHAAHGRCVCIVGNEDSTKEPHLMADNTITLVGNLTRDPELRFTTPVAALHRSVSPLVVAIK